MKIKIVFTLFIFGMTMVSCAEAEKWPEQTEFDYVSNCETAYVKSFKESMGDMIDMVDLDKLQEMAASGCACQYESLKKNYESAADAFSHSVDEQLANASECEATEAQIDDMLLE
ncbi:MAG: hypothetical protein ACI8XB_002357 [Patiriisocius sp.]|jgi:hypothetical protein